MKTKILDGALVVLQNKGARFTMDDLAKELSMSKKTIYRVFPDKSTMLYDLIDYVFDRIKQEEARIADDAGMRADEKFKAILCVLPDSFSGMDFSRLYQLKERYPKHYRRIEERLENGWETTWRILDEATKAGFFREINRPVFQLAYGSALERFLSSGELSQAGVSYVTAMQDLVDMLVDGIRV